MSECCLSNTLGEIVDRFLIRSSIEKKKHFSRYLILAEECWQDVFQNTLWVIKSVWMPTKAGTPYNYVNMPCDCQRLLSVGTDDKCGLIQPLYYNQQINIVAKPVEKKCGCKADCGCSSLCETVGSTVATSKVEFTISGVNYYQTCWITSCPNGDILKWCRTPVKKYNSLDGDAGDFNEDYNLDYLKGNPPFSDYTVVYIETQEKICKLAVRECGCPVESEANETLFMDCCGFWVNLNCRTKIKHCRQYSENVNNNMRGDCKISECGNKIYYRPSREWRKVQDKEVPDWLLVNYQSTGTSVGQETIVPIYARNLMYAMLDCGRKEYNGAYSLGEKEAARFRVVDERQKIAGYLNPLSLIFMGSVQDAKILW